MPEPPDPAPILDSGPAPAFKVFLSHRYKSWQVNLYFFNLFAEVAQLQFDVDEGVTAMNVTRLERMLRGCDAFVGIYPYDGNDVPTPEELARASRFFRLELDLAQRSGRPMIVFCDQRYGALLRCPPPAATVTFDSQEVTAAGGFPSADQHRKAFNRFCELVQSWRSYRVSLAREDRSGVGLLLPDPTYSAEDRQVVTEQLERQGFDEIEALPQPPRLDRQTRKAAGHLDLLVTDVTVGGAAAAIVAYLHARFMPMVRLARSDGADATPSPLEQALFGAYEVGYPSDVIRWREISELRAGLHERLVGLRRPVRRISTLEHAEQYFLGSAKRKESVFLSYSGSDADVAADVSAALKRRFQQVFDYRDGQSLTGGQAWLPAIFDQLSASAVGVTLLSTSYFASGNCVHEAEQMVALRDSHKMTVVPVKLSGATPELPTFLASIQSWRLGDFPNPDALVESLIAMLGKSERSRSRRALAGQ